MQAAGRERWSGMGMRALVTGAAGFIGSHLVDRLVALGWEVCGVDALLPYYSPAAKLRNLAAASGSAHFRLLQEDIRTCDLEPLLDDSTVVYHLEGQPGVADSWQTFDSYVAHNIVATQRVLQATANRGVRRVVLASSSSVYGNTLELPLHEDRVPAPISPYGVTKQAAEQIALAYADRFALPLVILRYFTVYGPRQRPDMAIARFIARIAQGREVEVYGDGTQTRDVTYVSDVVEATIRAGASDGACAVVNVAGGARVSVLALIDAVAAALGQRARLRHLAP